VPGDIEPTFPLKEDAMNQYCMFKGTLLRAAPYEDRYVGSPHYVLILKNGNDETFKVVINSASTEVGGDGSNDVYFYADLNFSDPLTAKLVDLAPGLHTTGFPKLDYWQDRSLLDLRRMRAVPYANDAGDRVDVNDIIDDVLTIDETRDSEALPYDNGSGQTQDRLFWTPLDPAVTVYGFGFLFLPQQDGLHETHMNQGNPRGRHWKENGAFQDGAVIVERAGGFMALFTAFQTQCLPTDALGRPEHGAMPLPEFIRS
jgi:uncharacterized protein YukJ